MKRGRKLRENIISNCEKKNGVRMKKRNEKRKKLQKKTSEAISERKKRVVTWRRKLKV